MSNEYGNDDTVSIETILDLYPEARPLADLIQATTIEEYASVAREIAAKVKSGATKAKPASAPNAPTPTKPVVSVKDAIESRSWPNYLAAKWDATAGERA